MKRLLFLFVLTVSAFSHERAFSQGKFTTSTDSARSTAIDGFSRDHWFTLMPNGSSGSTYRLAVTACKATAIHLAHGNGSPQTFHVRANEELETTISPAWLISESGAMDVGIHVWSDDADLTVSASSSGISTAGAFSILPSATWGREYIVASFNSEAYSGMTDFPSEFAIVADKDNTVVTIIPTADIRGSFSPNLEHKRNVPFEVELHKGHAVLYQAMPAHGNMEDFDLSGTRITATKTIGVISGAMCSNVPAENPSCDHLVEMMMPVDRWGKNYFTAPFERRHGGDAVLVIAAEDNTTIIRGSRSGVQTHCVLNRYQQYIRHDIDEASNWFSDKPFMIVQLMNGEVYPDAGVNKGLGAPSMVVVPPTEQYRKSVRIALPSVGASADTFQNVINVVVHKSAIPSTKIDGVQLSAAGTNIDNNLEDYAIFRVRNVEPGTHDIVSTSGVGVYSYGYLPQRAYALAGEMGSFVNSKTDSIPPIVTEVTQECHTLSVKLADPGDSASGGLMISIDSTLNIRASYSSSGGAQIQYTIVVLDSAKPAFARILVSDGAGNRRILTHAFFPDLPQLSTATISLRVPIGEVRTVAIPLRAGNLASLNNIRPELKQHTSFQILSAPASLNAAQQDSIIILYSQSTNQVNSDTLTVRADCWKQEIALRGSSTPFYDLDITDSVLNFKRVVVGESRTLHDSVYNYGVESFTIDSVRLLDTSNFKLTVGVLPTVVLSGDSLGFSISFEPKSDGAKQSQVNVYTSQGMFAVKLRGEGVGLESVTEQQHDGFRLYPNPAKDLLTITAEEYVSTITVRILDITGRESKRATFSGSHLELDISELTPGVYLAEVEMNGHIVLRKFTVSK